jgi:hypothetical protein
MNGSAMPHRTGKMRRSALACTRAKARFNNCSFGNILAIARRGQCLKKRWWITGIGGGIVRIDEVGAVITCVAHVWLNSPRFQ